MKIKSLSVIELIVTLFFVLTSIYLLIEIPLHYFLPKGIYYQGHFNDNTGFIYMPGSRVLYNKEKFVANNVNNDGFLDVNHLHESENGSEKTNIAFFGDESIESIKIPLKNKFFRKLNFNYNDKQFEYFAYGLKGYGLYQNYLNWI